MEKPTWSTGRLVLAAVVLAAAVTGALFIGFARLATGDWFVFTANNESVIEIAVRSAITTAGVIGVAIAGAVTYRRQLLNERQHELQITRDQAVSERDQRDYDLTVVRDQRDHLTAVERALRDRFTVSCSQLGDPDSATVRMAGVYSLAALADDWLALVRPEEAQVCIDVLCSYFRGEGAAAKESSDARDEDNGVAPAKDRSDPASDPGVKQTIARVISRRMHGLDTLHPGPWSALSFDFRRSAIDFDVQFDNITLAGGRLDFSESMVTSGTVVFFQMSVLSGILSWDRATVAGGALVFRSSEFSSDVTLQRLRVASSESGGTIEFDECAVLAGRVDLSRSQFGSDKRHGEILFTKCSIDGGCVVLDQSQFRNCEVEFEELTIESGAITLNGVHGWEYPSLGFSKCQLVGGRLDVLPLKVRRFDDFDGVPRHFMRRERHMRLDMGDREYDKQPYIGKGWISFIACNFDGCAVSFAKEFHGGVRFEHCLVTNAASRPIGFWPRRGRLTYYRQPADEKS